MISQRPLNKEIEENHLLLTHPKQIEDYFIAQSLEIGTEDNEVATQQRIIEAVNLCNKGELCEAFALVEEVGAVLASSNSEGYMQVLYIKAVLLRQRGAIHQSFECLKEMLTLIDNDKYQYYIYSELAVIFISNGLLQPDKAIYYANQARVYETTKEQVIVHLNYAINPSFVLGQAYMLLSQYERGEQAFDNSMSIAAEVGNTVLYERSKLAKLYATIKLKGVLKVSDSELNILYENKQTDNCKRFAIEQLLKVEELYCELEAYGQAKKSLKEALALANEYNFLDFRLSVTKRLGELAKMTGDYENGFLYQTKYIELFEQEHPTFDSSTIPKGNYDSYIKHIKRLEKTNSLIELSTNDLTQYAFIVAHDLKEPLRNISSFSKLLRRNIGANVKQEHLFALNMIEEKTSLLGNALNALLMFASLDTKKERDVVDLISSVHQATKKCEHGINQTRAIVNAERLPKVWGNASMWALFFEELIKNSIDFSLNTPQINITKVDKKSICYEDNSIGINAEEAEKVFDVFYRHKDATDRPGMGLALCRKIAQLQGASIKIDTSYTPGLRFNIKL